MIKVVLILAGVIVLLLVAGVLLFKAWRKQANKYKAEHERAERLRSLVEKEQKQNEIVTEELNNAEKQNHKTDNLSGRDKFDAITDELRND